MTIEKIDGLADEAVPVFGQNFGEFRNFIKSEASPSISPKRFGLILSVDMKTLAAQAHVHANTVRLAPDSQTVQWYLRESVRVMRAASELSGSIEKAIYWFMNYPLPTFDYRTPQELVSARRTDALIEYIQSLQTGVAG